jgi:hypothetical protein
MDQPIWHTIFSRLEMHGGWKTPALCYDSTTKPNQKPPEVGLRAMDE